MGWFGSVRVVRYNRFKFDRGAKFVCLPGGGRLESGLSGSGGRASIERSLSREGWG